MKAVILAGGFGTRISEESGVRPGQTVTFEVRFGDAPLQNSKSVRLVIEPATFGQSSGAMFEIPIEAFYGVKKKGGGEINF